MLCFNLFAQRRQRIDARHDVFFDKEELSPIDIVVRCQGSADRIDKVAEPERRAFTYLMLSTVRFAYASFARLLLLLLFLS